MVKKLSKKKPTVKSNRQIIELETDEPVVCFKLGVEEIEGTVATFHRLAVQAQHKALVDRDDSDDYMPEYAALLKSHFDIDFDITPPIAYRIFDTTWNMFYQLKKNTNT